MRVPAKHSNSGLQLLKQRLKRGLKHVETGVVTYGYSPVVSLSVLENPRGAVFPHQPMIPKFERPIQILWSFQSFPISTMVSKGMFIVFGWDSAAGFPGGKPWQPNMAMAFECSQLTYPHIFRTVSLFHFGKSQS